MKSQTLFSTLLFYSLVFLLPFPASGQAGAYNKCPIDADIWVLAGQSNMQGAGRTRDTLTDDRIWMLNMDHTWMVAQTPLHRIYESTEPAYPIAHFELNPKAYGNLDSAFRRFKELREKSEKDPIGGVGPGIYFARHD